MDQLSLLIATMRWSLSIPKCCIWCWYMSPRNMKMWMRYIGWGPHLWCKTLIHCCLLHGQLLRTCSQTIWPSWSMIQLIGWGHISYDSSSTQHALCTWAGQHFMANGAKLVDRWIIVRHVPVSIWTIGVLFVGHWWVPISWTMHVSPNDDQTVVFLLQHTPPL